MRKGDLLGHLRTKLRGKELKEVKLVLLFFVCLLAFDIYKGELNKIFHENLNLSKGKVLE